jgi:hypothetical protein
MEGSNSSSNNNNLMMTMSVSAAAATARQSRRRISQQQQRLGSHQQDDPLLIQQQQQHLQHQLQQQQHQRHHDRIPLVQRLYGPDNAEVRRNVLELQERLERSQTGFNGDANHIVPYENHPFEVLQRQRRHAQRQRQRHARQLQDATDDTAADAGNYDDMEEDTSTSTNTVTSVANSLFRPIRIHFETKALDDIRDEENAAKIECKYICVWYDVPVASLLLLPDTRNSFAHSLFSGSSVCSSFVSLYRVQGGDFAQNGRLLARSLGGRARFGSPAH